MKIYPSKLKVTIAFLISLLVIAGLVFCIFFNFFMSKWELLHWIILGSYILVFIALYILTIKTTFYVIKSDSFVFTRWGKADEYYYKDIIYIEDLSNSKSKTITLALFTGQVIYLNGDTKKKLYNELIIRSLNLMDYSSVKSKYPNIKL